jgi:hypothetical protein
LRISCREEGKALLARHDLEPVPHNRGKPCAEPLRLGALAAEQSDLLRILAEPHEGKPEISLIALLVEVEPDKGSADHMRDPGAGRRIEECSPDQIAWNDEARPERGQGNRCREAPRNDAERDQPDSISEDIDTD